MITQKLADAAHAVAHTARMQQRLAERPDHPRTAEYARSMKVYAGQWAACSAAEQADVLVIVNNEAKDLTLETIAAAVAALES